MDRSKSNTCLSHLLLSDWAATGTYCAVQVFLARCCGKWLCKMTWAREMALRLVLSAPNPIDPEIMSLPPACILVLPIPCFHCYTLFTSSTILPLGSIKSAVEIYSVRRAWHTVTSSFPCNDLRHVSGELICHPLSPTASLPAALAALHMLAFTPSPRFPQRPTLPTPIEELVTFCNWLSPGMDFTYSCPPSTSRSACGPHLLVAQPQP